MIDCDIAIIGGGIIGVATAAALARQARAQVVLLEAEQRLAAHQTGNNSGVIHSGLYYRPGSLKARNCAAGREALYRFCAQEGIPHERCGKIVVAVHPRELPMLDQLMRRATANGLEGLCRLAAEEIREREPAAAGLAGLWVPQTGIVDYTQVTHRLAARVTEAGGAIHTGARVTGIHRDAGRLRLEATEKEVRCRLMINCAGLQSDRIAQRSGVNPDLRIVPFRGEYYELHPERRRLVRSLIYPVPDPTLPFLGVHFTRRIDGSVEAGPNAVLAFRREGYRKTSFSLRDTCATLTYPGFWRLAAHFWRIGAGEYYRSFFKGAFVHALQRLVPEIRPRDVVAGGAGVRAQALDRTGRLVDDFRIAEEAGMIHVLNAPSPAATACLSIGEHIAQRASERLAEGA
ncbi:MAG: L-2-hydroxyglutarate oxidase [Candidatus Eisenbacteria sp.]|nr:L-2-hydroxyglutarate oxidase [Candidatus Eisenbacteria bacterium]